MDPVALLKALLIHAAYEGACAVCEPLISNPDGTQVQIDPLIQDSGLKQKGLLVYEEAKVQYAAILRAFADKTGIWPDPVLPAGSKPIAAPAKPAAAIPSPGADIAGTVAAVAGAVGQAAQAVQGATNLGK
jgi:hypothetical protein